MGRRETALVMIHSVIVERQALAMMANRTAMQKLCSPEKTEFMEARGRSTKSLVSAVL